MLATQVISFRISAGTAKTVVFETRAVNQRACILVSAFYCETFFSIAIDKRPRYVVGKARLLELRQIKPEIC
jgi:hypothetical protein